MNPFTSSGCLVPALFRREVFFPPGKGATLFWSNLIDETFGIFEKDTIIIAAFHLD